MWFKVEEIKPNLFHVKEPEHVSFFIFKNKDGVITRITNYYNLKDWIKQVSK